MRREVALTVEQDPGKDQEGGKEGRRMPSPESSPEWTTFTKEPTCISASRRLSLAAAMKMLSLGSVPTLVLSFEEQSNEELRQHNQEQLLRSFAPSFLLTGQILSWQTNISSCWFMQHRDHPCMSIW